MKKSIRSIINISTLLILFLIIGFQPISANSSKSKVYTNIQKKVTTEPEKTEYGVIKKVNNNKTITRDDMWQAASVNENNGNIEYSGNNPQGNGSVSYHYYTVDNPSWAGRYLWRTSGGGIPAWVNYDCTFAETTAPDYVRLWFRAHGTASSGTYYSYLYIEVNDNILFNGYDYLVEGDWSWYYIDLNTSYFVSGINEFNVGTSDEAYTYVALSDIEVDWIGVPVGGIDLTLDDPSSEYTYDPQTYALDITIGVKNIGTTDCTDDFYDGYWLSANTSWTDMIYLGKDLESSTVSAGGSDVETESELFDLLNVSGLSSGTYYVHMFIDNDNDIVETNENNNKWHFNTPIVVDFIYINPESHSSPSGGDTFVISVGSDRSWNVTSSTWIDCSPTSGNNSGSITVTVEPNPNSTERTGYVDVTAGTVTRTCTITQEPDEQHPDLTVTDIWTDPATPTQGQSCTLYAKVKNIGDANSSSTTHTWYWYSPQQPCGSSVSVQTLNPNQEVTVSKSYTFTASGTNTFKGYVEPVSGEQNTNNNDKQESLTVQQQSNNMTLSLPTDATGGPGESISIPLTLDNPDGESIEGIDATITFDFDPLILTSTGGTLTGTVLDGMNYGYQFNPSSGQVQVVIYANANLYTGSGIVAYLTFDVNEYAQIGDTTSLVFTQSEVNETTVNHVDGFFTVMPTTFDISGTVEYFSNSNGVPNTTVQLTGDGTYTEITDSNGDYSLAAIDGGNYTSDCSKTDHLGGLSGTDASRIARYAAGLFSLNDYEQIAADVSMNGSISGTDASRVARYAAGLIDDLNNGIDWVFVTELGTGSPPSYESTYQYNPLDEDKYDQDFTAIRLGDVTGNWTPGSLKNEISGYITSIQLDINSTLQLPIVINSSNSIEGIDIIMEYNQKVLRPINIILNNILEAQNYTIESLFKDGHGNIIIYAQEQPTNYSNIVATLNFEVIGSSNEQIDLCINNLDVNESQNNGGFLVNNGETITRAVKINQQNNSQELMCSIFPNPCTSHTTIDYSLKEYSHVQIFLYNTRGQLIETLHDGFEDAGENQITLNTDELNNGIYFCRINAGIQTQNIKLLIMK